MQSPSLVYLCLKNKWVRRVLVVVALISSTYRSSSAPDPIRWPSSLPIEARDQLEKLTTAMNLAHLEWTEADSGEDKAKVFVAPREFSLWLDEGKFRTRNTYFYAKGYGIELRGGKETGELSFDGNFFYFGVPNRPIKTNPSDLIKYDPFDEGDPDRIERRVYLDYLNLAGFHVPESPADLTAVPLISSLVLYYLTNGDLMDVSTNAQALRVTFKVPDPILVHARAVSLEREQKRLSKLKNGPEFAAKQIEYLQKMRSAPPERIVNLELDPAQAYAVVTREDSTPSGQLILRATCNKWKHYENVDIWLPSHIVEELYTGRAELTGFSDHPRLTLTYDLTKASFGRSTNIQFALQADPEYKKAGTSIEDRTGPLAQAAHDHYVDYIIAADGQTVRANTLTVLNQVRDWKKTLMMAIILAAFLALPSIIYVVSHRRNTTRA